MAKKSFSKGIDVFFGDTTKEMKKPVKETEDPKPLFQEDESLKIEKRATFLIEVDHLDKIKALAYWERTTSKSILKQALEQFFSSKGQKYMKEAIEYYKQNNLNGSDD